MQKLKFGTDGWRAVMDKEFTFENVERMAQAFSAYVRETHKASGNASKPRIVVGYDYRKNSDRYAETFVQVLLGNGLEVTLSDSAVPTPAVSRAVIQGQCHAGIMVTASHNPWSYNGIKIKDSQGSSASSSVTHKVEALMDRSASRSWPTRTPSRSSRATARKRSAGSTKFKSAPLKNGASI